MGLASPALRETHDLLTHHPVFLIGLLLVVGYFVGKLAMRIRLPEITGFILAGLVVSSFTTGIVSAEMNESLHIVTEVAIGLLALTIGGEFSARKLRRIGKDVATITAVHLMVTVALVVAGCVLLNLAFPSLQVGMPYALLLGVIACATSPAIIVAEIHHLRAHGKFIDYLFGVVALGDAVAVVVFGLTFTLVTNLLDLSVASHHVLVQSLREIVLSVLCGLAAAGPLHLLARKVRSQNEILILIVGAVFVITGASMVLHLSPLLANMALGAALINLSPLHHRMFRAIDPLTPPIYALFFVIAGIELDPRVFTQGAALAVGACYILTRAAGKFGGAWLGCRARHLEPRIPRYLGLCMFPQGGVALGFVLLIQTSPALAAVRGDPAIYGVFNNLVNVVLMSIFVNELVSPLFIRQAVLRGNDMEV